MCQARFQKILWRRHWNRRHQSLRHRSLRHRSWRHRSWRHRTQRHQSQRHRTWRHWTWRHRSLRHWSWRHWSRRHKWENLRPGTGIWCNGFQMSLNLAPLTAEAILSPRFTSFARKFQDKTLGNKSPWGTFIRMRNLVDGVENCSSHRFWNQGTKDTCRDITE